MCGAGPKALAYWSSYGGRSIPHAISTNATLPALSVRIQIWRRSGNRALKLPSLSGGIGWIAEIHITICVSDVERPPLLFQRLVRMLVPFSSTAGSGRRAEPDPFKFVAAKESLKS